MTPKSILGECLPASDFQVRGCGIDFNCLKVRCWAELEKWDKEGHSATRQIRRVRPRLWLEENEIKAMGLGVSQ